MAALALTALAVVGAAAQGLEPNVNTATAASSVYAAQATAATSHETSYVRGKSFDRFITIWLENTDYSKASADPNLSYLATKGITLSNYFGVTHPSEPNYCASHGGDNFGMDNDDFHQAAANVSAITALLEDKHISWGSYQQHMPYTGFEGFSWVNQANGANDYVRKHNPPVLYDQNTSPESLSYQKNFTEFYADLAAHKLPQWSFITPNMTNDGHDSSVTVAGQFCRDFLTPLMENEYFMERTLILLTFDENETYEIGNRVFSILLGGAVPENLVGTTDDNFYNHYSELATVEANWDLHTLGRWDVGANVFSMVASETGDEVRPYPAATGPNPTIFYNSSFAGPFNDDVGFAPYPAPNLDIVSPRTGRTVLPAIVDAWKGKNSGTYGWGGWGSKKLYRIPRGGKTPQTYYTPTLEVYDGQHPPPGYAVNTVDN